MSDPIQQLTGWQPIQTAPADVGAIVDLMIPPFGCVQATRMAFGGWHVDPKHFTDSAGQLKPSLFIPTHWRKVSAWVA